MWQAIYRTVDMISRVMAWFAGITILLIALMQLAEIISRNLFNHSLSFVWEYATYMHISAIFMGLAFTLRTGGHIQVTLFSAAFPKGFNFVSTLLGLAISSYLSVAMIRVCYNWGVTGRSSGTVDNLPLVYPMAFVAFGASMLTLQLALRLVHLLMGTRLELSWSNSPSAE